MSDIVFTARFAAWVTVRFNEIGWGVIDGPILCAVCKEDTGG